MQQKQISPLLAIWLLNAILLVVYAVGSPSISFLKSSVLEYNNISSDPFDGAVSPIAYIPDWSKAENMNKARLFDSFSVAEFIEIPEYNIDTLGDMGQKDKAATILRYTYPVVYMGSYRGNYIEYDGSHGAVDIRAPIGTPIVSVANGVVVKTKNDETGDGKYVIIRHDDVEIDGTKQTLYSTYEHMSEITAIEGMKIGRGELIGKVGMTGITTTPHVHFQIDKSSAPFHAYWPYTFKQAADLGLDFFGAINVGLGKENMIRYTVNPMELIKNHPFLGSAPKDIIAIQEPQTPSVVASTELVADLNPPHVTVPTIIAPVEITPVETPVPIETKPITTTEHILTQAEIIHPVKMSTPSFVPDANHIFSDIALDSAFYEATKYLSNA